MLYEFIFEPAPRLRQHRRKVGFGSKTVLTPLKWDVRFTPESRHRSAYAADCDVIVCYGNVKPADQHPRLPGL